jgi:hypothetical protein
MKKLLILLLLLFIKVSVFALSSYTTITRTIKHGTVSIEKPIDIGKTGIEEIVFTYSLNKKGKEITFANVLYSENAYSRIENLVVQNLNKRKIPIRKPMINIFDDATTDNKTIQLFMSNGNTVSMFGDGSKYLTGGHLYTLKYSVIIPYSQPIYSRIHDITSGKSNAEIDKFIRTRKALRIAGISTFAAGMTSAILLHMATVITYFFFRDVLPIEVPMSLLFTGFGTLVLSLTVGLPLWGVSKVKKKYTINFK